ncbi:MAG TPA: hypothetical protein VFO57_01780 [Burkholderiales bacterium]|nr:hypothetical protein [Burkholderiales bacterium]
MKANRLLALGAALLPAVTGCASITGSTMQPMTVETRDKGGKEVTGAACDLNNNKGKWSVTTPGSVVITRSNDNLLVVCQKEGHETGNASVVSTVKGALFGNIIFGGGIGAIIDHASGSAYEYPQLIPIEMGSVRVIQAPREPETPQQP